jgi:hypothetical protein
MQSAMPQHLTFNFSNIITLILWHTSVGSCLEVRDVNDIFLVIYPIRIIFDKIDIDKKSSSIYLM